MKNYFSILMLCSLGLWGVMTAAQAQQAQRLVSVVVSPDHADWKYKAGEEATFTVQVYKFGHLLRDVAVDYELGPEFFPTVEKKDVVLKEGKTTLKGVMKEPGLLRCRVVAKVDGRNYEGMAGALYDDGKILPVSDEPADFDAFWAKAIEDARRAPLDAVRTLLPEKSTATQDVYEVSFRNTGFARVYGILMIPKKPGKYPAVLQVPGAGVRPYNGVNYGEDVISLEIGVHGIPVTMAQSVYFSIYGGALNGYWEFSKNNKDQFYYKRVYVGCVRAVDYLFSLPEFDGETVGVSGSSQGGALSIATAALDPRIRFLAPIHPAMCDLGGFLKKRAGGWPHYFRFTKPESGEVETLSYYDIANFARRVHVPGLYSWGLNDVTCPPTSMYAAYNMITAPKDLKVYNDSGHWIYSEQQAATTQWLKDQCKK
ncbi:MAG: acetylxylan esterase [Tannerellaceae bacterium]|jgi:cephalosporin-C deacetylase-like acetyl esterase|nr:acetylxylan esterase [Tannerellaceae bacterium]